MIRVGIYLVCEPYSGGVYQYSLSILSSLESYDKTKYKVTVFIHNEDWIKHLPNNFDIVLTSRTLVSKLFGRLYPLLDRYLGGAKRFAPYFNPLVAEINNSGCDLVIFPSQDALSYQVTKKSLVAIHDLMHRYEPHFEEYQHGEFDRRERHYSLICKYASGILVDSNIGKSHVLESYQPPDSKVHILPFVPPFYLLDAVNVNVKKKYSLPDSYIFYPAQFWEHKNHINLLLAQKRLKDEGLDIHLVLVGSKKNNYTKVLREIGLLGLQDNVSILGYVSNDDMASLYQSAHATVFVSLLGPTNIPPMEALLVGSPLICSNVYGMPDQVNGAALLVDPKSPVDIAEKIKHSFTNCESAIGRVAQGLNVIESYGVIEFAGRLELYISRALA